MKRATSWGLCLTGAVVLFVLFSDFTPRAGTTPKPRADNPQPASSSTAVYRSPSQRHKITVSDPKIVEALKAQGGRVVADYGSFVLMEGSDAVASSLDGSGAAQVVDENNLVLLNAGAIDTSTDAVQSRRTGITPTAGKQMHLIQFAGPIRPEWYQALVATGVRVVTYIPNNAYLVYGTAEHLQAVQRLASDRKVAQWDGAYTSAFRIDPAVKATAARAAKSKDAPTQGKDRAPAQMNLSVQGNEQFTIQMVEDQAENLGTLALIDQFKLEPIIKQDTMLGYFNVRVALPRDVVITQIAERGDVVSIQQWATPKKKDERQDIILTGSVTGNPAVPTPMDYLAYLAGKGFSTSTTASFGVNLSDSGVDNATTTPNHFALYRVGDPTVPANSRIIYNRLQGTPNGGSTLQGCDGHGNENSHIIGGYVPTGTVGGVNFGAAPHADASGFRWDLGIAPFVKIGSSVIFDPDTFTSPIYQNLESQAYRDTARISSNSWGSSSNAYTVDAQQYDGLVRDAQPDTGCSLPNCISTVGNQEYVIIFAAGNDGSGSNTVGEPGTAKNVITVGASENVNPFGGADACGVGDTGADNANDIIGFSSRGPTSDGRKKPDIMGPGTHVSAGVAQASIASPTGSGTGAQLACFDGTGVCGGTGGSNFFPAGQQWYTASSGTSHSTPAIAGIAALIRQHFINQAAPLPSAAMTKGLLMNSARYMNGVGANDSLPSNNQGMGEANMNSYFDIFTTAHSFHDQAPAETFTASGQQRVITGTVPDIAKPFRVTLAWTDTPGPTSGNAFVNNLDLEVTVGGNTYKGNVFSGASSATGGVADIRNNVESVFIPAGVSGNFVVKVKATNIAGDGVPNNAQPLDQDFALIVYNATEGALPVIAGGATAITAESCAPANNAIDPGETVTVNFDLSNVGTANTTNLVATLLATGGVTSPSGPQNYGVVVAGGPPVTRPFTFTANTTCGQTITATFQLQDGASNLGNITFTFLTGGLGAPVTATYSSGNIATAIPDEASVDVPINIADTGVITDVNVRVRANHTFDGDLVFELVGPDGTIVPLSTNRGGSGDNFGTGATDCSGTPTVFDDAAATAISAGAAPFAGSFRPESPLSAFNGKTITGAWKLRATDTAADDTGTIFCATLEITRQRFVCCGVTGTPQIVSGGPAAITAENFTPPNNAADPGETLTVNLPVINTGDGNTTNLVGTLQATGGVTAPSGPQNYGVVVAGGPAVARPFTFTAQGSCGSTITLTVAFQDGALNLGTVQYTMQLGTLTVTPLFSENFDGVSAPALPAGWVTAATGVELPWVTSTTTPSNAPNDAFAPDVTNVGNTTLDTPTINVPAGGGQLTFQNLFNLEASAVTPTTGFDGMVLEISINGGAFNDITTGGNAFIAGGYTRTISGGFSSPIGGRQAWSGLSGGTTAAPTYITSTINLPAAAAGQPIKLRWRVATDSSAVAAGTAGARIDAISITGSSFVCAGATSLVISEFRERGPAGVNDEYVEFYNKSDASITVTTSDASAGWALVSSDGVTRFVIPSGTVIPARGHYLAANSLGYSTGGYATADVTWATDIPDNSGLALFNSATSLVAANRLDAAGFTTSPALYREGVGLATFTAFNTDSTEYRELRTGLPADTDDNLADFRYVDTNGTLNGGQQRLGAPGPENLAAPRHTTTGSLTDSRIDPSVSTGSAPNFVFDPTSVPAQNSSFGTILIRRTFTNNTGAPLTQLRFRVVDISTFPSPAGTADLRPRTSAGGAVPIGGVNPACPGNNCAMQVLTLQQPPSQPNGGGFNSSWGANTVTAGTPLANGASINVEFLMGIQQSGCYRFIVIAESLPNGVSSILGISGSAGPAGSCTGNPPTAAPASISGRVLTESGTPVPGVTMNLGGASTARAITDSNGNYRFSNVNTDNFYTVTPALSNYHFGPESRSFSLLSNITDAVFTAERDPVGGGNAIDSAGFFVRQHYLDFLSREPDESGFNFWIDQMLECGSDANCAERRRINVSAAYFLSIEFQQTGGLVDGLYRTSYNRRPQYAEFMPDTAVIARNVVVGSPNWAGTLDANKRAFVEAWVQRPDFQSTYGGLGDSGYVDALISHTGVSFSQSERNALVSALSGGTSTRADVLMQIAENERFVAAKRNETFVMMQYFGYLRRDPDASGYQFWLNKLNQFNGNFEQAEMVKAFLVSGEYRSRFGQ
jgi:subtilisin-like proprotein convertase family protein